MKNVIIHFNLFFVLVLCCLLLLASFATAGQKAIGAYTTTSQAATASSNYPVQSGNTGLRLLPAPAIRTYAAALTGVYYVASVVARTMVETTYMGVTSELVQNGSQLGVIGYEATDFFQFD